MAGPGRWMIHLKDGSTLTDKECYPHEIDSEQITSVERVIKRWHFSILKSPLIEWFFVITDVYQDMVLVQGRSGPPPTVTMRWVGCYLKESDPIVKCMLGMDPRTKNVVFEACYVKKKRRNGFAPRLKKLSKNALRSFIARPIAEKQYAIVKAGPVRRIYGLPDGIGCLIGVNKAKRTRVKAEIHVRGRNVQLSFIPS